jgi:ATP-dependent Clp protease, protease subunit
VDVAARQTIDLTTKCPQILAAHTGQPFETVKADAQRDYDTTAAEAQAYGIVDQILGAKPILAVSPNGREH